VPDVGDDGHEVLVVSNVIDVSDIDLRVLLLVGGHLLDDQVNVG